MKSEEEPDSKALPLERGFRERVDLRHATL